MPMYNPCHPGEVLLHECIKPRCLSIARVAKGLGVSEQELDDLVNERASVTADMAIRLTEAFGLSPETWLGMQMAYDLWHARQDADRVPAEDFGPVEELVASGG